MSQENQLLKWNYDQLKANSDKMSEKMSNNQMQLLTNQVLKVKEWDENSIMKAVVLKFKGGSNVLEFTRKHVCPLPSLRTIQRHFEKLDFMPGILSDNLKVLKNLVTDFSLSQLRFGLYFDEKAFIPGESRVGGTDNFIGKVTLPPRDEYASNVLLFLVGGIQERIKIPVAFHFTSKSDTGKAQAEFLLKIIIETEEKTGIFIDFICFDLGPTNQAMLKELGNSIGKSNKNFHISHPRDSERKLFLVPDNEHCCKNLIANFRNHDVEIPQKFVQKYSLSSNIAKLSDVEKLCKSQMKLDFKADKNLTDAIINPDHFAKMKSHTFEAIMTESVVASLELHDQIKRKRDSNKVSATAFVLAKIDQWHHLTSKGELCVEDENYSEIKNFLLESIEIIDNLKFNNRHNICQTGAVWATLALLELTEYWSTIEMPHTKVKYLLNNCIENAFSIISSKQIKPSPCHIVEGIKAYSISKFFNDPITGSYNWERDSFENGFSLLKYLKGKREKTQNFVDVYEPKIDIPTIVKMQDIFDYDYEHFTFYCFICDTINDIFSKHSCDDCKDLCIDQENVREKYHKLQNIKSSTDHPLIFKFSHNTIVLRPSKLLENLFMQLEFVYSEILQHEENSSVIKNAFMKEVESNFLIPIHCETLHEKIIQTFITKRLNISKEIRLVHRKSRFASKSLQ